MRCKIYLSSVLLIVLCSNCIAQENFKGVLAIETDPFSTIFGAKTLSVILEPQEWKYWSLFTNVVSADFPNWMDDILNPKNKDKGFDAKISIGAGLGVDYFKKEEKEGVYVGLITLFFQNAISRNNQSERVITQNLIPRVGYRWYPFKNNKLYLNPFFGVRYEYSLGKKIVVDGEEYKAAGIQPFGTIHIGYHF